MLDGHECAAFLVTWGTSPLNAVWATQVQSTPAQVVSGRPGVSFEDSVKHSQSDVVKPATPG